ncbi:MAG: hypothetical protein ACXWJX_13130 [Limisphaerales bacterium]
MTRNASMASDFAIKTNALMDCMTRTAVHRITIPKKVIAGNLNECN